MKNLICSLFVILSISGCKSLPPQPKVGENTFAVQIISVNTQRPVQNTISIKDILKTPGGIIFEYPVSYMEVGKSGRNSQTYKVQMPEAHAYYKGRYLPDETAFRFYEMVIIKASSNDVTYSIDIMHMDFTGFTTIIDDDGSEVVVPDFKGGGITTAITQPLGEWNIISGIESDREGNESQSDHYFCIRIISPLNLPANSESLAIQNFELGSTYIPSFTIYRSDEISPPQAISLAKEFARNNSDDSVDLESAKVLFNSVNEWTVDFTVPELLEKGMSTYNRLISINKKTGAAKYLPVY